MIGDIELDASKLSPEEAAERWRVAGEKLRTTKADTFRKAFAWVESLVAGDGKGTADPDDRARVAIVTGGSTDATEQDARAAIYAAVMGALDAIAADPRNTVRYRSVEALLRSIDWSAVDIDLVRMIVHSVVSTVPLAVLELASPLAAEAPTPIVGMGIADVARVIVEVSAREAEHGHGADVAKGEN